MTALEPGDLETCARCSRRSTESVNSPQRLLLAPPAGHSTGVGASCSAARSHLGKASSLASEPTWNYSWPFSPSFTNKAWTHQQAKHQRWATLVSAGKRDSMS